MSHKNPPNDLIAIVAQRCLSFSVPPIVERVEVSVYRKTALMSRLFQISDCSHNFCVAHVSAVIILEYAEDAEMQRIVQLVQSLEIRGVLGDDGKAKFDREGKVIGVIRTSQSNAVIGRANHSMPSLS
jgi:hypothetical protein